MKKFPLINKFLAQGKFQLSALISVTQDKATFIIFTQDDKTTTAGYTLFEAELNVLIFFWQFDPEKCS